MTDLPWGIKDNDIHSKGIKSWSDRQQRGSELFSSSLVRRAYSDMLFGDYIAHQINETIEYNAIYDAIIPYKLDLLA